MMFGAITAAGSIATWVWLRATADGSDLLVTETAAWRVSAFRGLGMVAGFTIMALLVRTDRDEVGPKLSVGIEGAIDGHATVDDEHRVRRQLLDALDELSYDIWLNLELLPRVVDE